MRIKWLIPPQMNLEAIVRSIPDTVKENSVHFLGSESNYNPTDYDLLIYSGATDGIYSLSNDALKRLREKTKLINICVGGSDVNWHPFLEKFIKEDCFDLMVNIDGSEEWPRRWQDITTLPPVDPKPYHTVSKTLLCGFTGEPTPGRQAYMETLGVHVNEYRRNTGYGDYDRYASWICSLSFLLNMNFYTHTDKVNTVNMKTVEAGLGRCVLLDRKDGLVSKYLKPKVDYLEYDSPFDVMDILKCGLDFPDIADNLHKKMTTIYSAKEIWKRIFTALNSLDKVFPV